MILVWITRGIDELLQIYNIENIAPYKNVSATVSRGTTVSQRASIIATTRRIYECNKFDYK